MIQGCLGSRTSPCRDYASRFSQMVASGTDALRTDEFQIPAVTIGSRSFAATPLGTAATPETYVLKAGASGASGSTTSKAADLKRRRSGSSADCRSERLPISGHSDELRKVDELL